MYVCKLASHCVNLPLLLPLNSAIYVIILISIKRVNMKLTLGNLLVLSILIVFISISCSQQNPPNQSVEPVEPVQPPTENVTPVEPKVESSPVSPEITSTSKKIVKEEVVCAYKSEEAAQEFVNNVKQNFNTNNVEIEARGNCVVYKWYK